MARSDKTLIGEEAYGIMGGNPNASNLDLGGYFGWSPDLANFLSEQAYVRKPLEIVVIEAPKMFSLFPNPEKWYAAYRNLLERKVTRAEGFEQGIEVVLDEHNVGGAGEMHQEPVDVKRARTQPQLSFVEKYGRPIQRMIDIMTRYGIMDPDSKFPMMATLAANVPTDQLADWYSGTILAYEPDPVHQRVDKAWLTTNFFPQNNGQVSGVRDLTQQSELLRLTIPFTGISAVGNGITAFATEIMKATSIVNANPFNKQAFIKEISADIKAAATAGFGADITETSKNVVMPS